MMPSMLAITKISSHKNLGEVGHNLARKKAEEPWMLLDFYQLSKAKDTIFQAIATCNMIGPPETKKLFHLESSTCQCL